MNLAVSWSQDIYHYAVQSSEEKSPAIRQLPFVVCASLSLGNCRWRSWAVGALPQGPEASSSGIKYRLVQKSI
ncbi:hypothetical protein CDAR_441651 [Caerostris darwini]|uniref:Uncharacterized protein n=1 Tax=Caerostris darwini TaxID=1538125 RepID=A0AAV4QR49_9ARAC|nr:hypothetical protein CDAR_441651 [Caerostris darwini]